MNLSGCLLFLRHLGRLLVVALGIAMPNFGWAAALPNIPTESPRLLLTQWSHSNLNFADQTWFREIDGRFAAYFSSHIDLHKSSFCANLLEAAQNFPLNRMVNTNYISPTQKDLLQRIGDRLHPSQFRFFELVKAVTGEDLKNRNFDFTKGDIPSVALLLLEKDRILEVEGTLWTVSGQTTSSHVRIQSAKMPWQLDTAYADVPLDRTKYSYAWEIGRGAQKSPKNFQILVRAAIVSMLSDVFAYQGSLDDAYVFAHALGPGQKRLFQAAKTPGTDESVFKVFHQLDTEKTDVVLVAKLKDLIALFPPDEFSKLLHDVVKISNGKLDAVSAFEHLHAVRDSLRQDIDVVIPNYGHRSHPIVLRNTTPISGWFMAKVAERYDMFDIEGPQLANMLSQKPWLDVMGRSPDWLDPTLVPTEQISKSKLYAISNLDETLAKADKFYVKKILLATYSYYESLLRQNYPNETDMILSHTNFAITTAEPEISRQFKEISGGTTLSVQFVEYKSSFDSSPETGIVQKPRAIFTQHPIFVINGKDIAKLRNSHPEIDRQSRRAFRRGNWQILRHLKSPLDF